MTLKREFDFEEGDRVRVRVREDGTRGPIVAKFEGTVDLIYNHEMTAAAPKCRISLPWGALNSVTLRTYEAEFEVLPDE